jgi:membrane-associated phospholipid phosphatase
VKVFLTRLRRALFVLRPEELMTLLLFLPIAYALARVAAAPPEVLTGPAANYPKALTRLIVLLGSTAVFVAIIRFKPRWSIVRDAIPFLFCANIYANLHDLIVFYHAPDITAALYRWDVALFGFEPSIWAERFVHPALTDFFTFCYWLFYVLAPMLGLFLYLKKSHQAFRGTMVTVVMCLYLGYIGYVAWPAAAPRLYIPEVFSVPLHGTAILDYTRSATAAVPLTTQGAFPSLHCALALLAVLLAWRYMRWFAWVQLPFAAGLIVGTVYLRHHWVVDILAGFVITLFTLWAGPRLEDWWNRHAAPGVDRGEERQLGDPAKPPEPARKHREPASRPKVAAKVMES